MRAIVPLLRRERLARNRPPHVRRTAKPGAEQPSPRRSSGGAMLSSVTPSPASSTAASGSPASSPHTPTQHPCARGRRDGLLAPAAARPAGFRQAAPPAARSPRSAAIVYWVRSLVPSEKKSTCSASTIGGQRRGGHLDHDPELELGGDAGLRARARAPPARPRSRPRVATIGSITLTRVLGGHAQDRPELGGEHVRARQRQPDPPDAEKRVRFGGHRQCGQRLVGAGVERPHHQRPPAEVDRDPAQRLGLLVLVRQRGAVEEQNSVRSRPTPSAPSSTAAQRLADRAQVGEHLDPRAVTQRTPARARACAPPHAGARRVRDGSERRAGPRARVHQDVPARPSSSTVVPSAIASNPDPSPTTAGSPSARARIAACAVVEPPAVAIPVTSDGSSRAASAGVSSSAITIPGLGAAVSALAPLSSPTTRAPTSSTSVARSASSGSLSARYWPATATAASCQARSARCATLDRRPGRPQQRLVVEQRQVRVEDLRLGLTRASGDQFAVRADRSRSLRQCIVEARSLGRGIVDRRDPVAARPTRRRGATRSRAPPPAMRERPTADRPRRCGRREAPRAGAWTTTAVHAVAQSLRPPARCSAAIAACASGPVALTSSSSPIRAPAPRPSVRLVALDRRPVRAGLRDPHLGVEVANRLDERALPGGRAGRSCCVPRASAVASGGGTRRRRRRRGVLRRTRRAAMPSSPALLAPRLRPPRASRRRALRPRRQPPPRPAAPRSSSPRPTRRRASRSRTRRSSARCRGPSAPAPRRATSPARSPPARDRASVPEHARLVRSRRPPRAPVLAAHLAGEARPRLQRAPAVGDDRSIADHDPSAGAPGSTRPVRSSPYARYR